MAKKLVAESLGSFCLVFAGTGAIVVDAGTGGAVSHVGVALTFGLIVLVMIYTIGDISGAHINPAVTIGFFAARRFEAGCVFPYRCESVRWCSRSQRSAVVSVSKKRDTRGDRTRRFRDAIVCVRDDPDSIAHVRDP